MKRNQSPDNKYANIRREEIVHALTLSKGRVGGADGAAARMGINRTTLYCRMKKLGIDRWRYPNRTHVVTAADYAKDEIKDD